MTSSRSRAVALLALVTLTMGACAVPGPAAPSGTSPGGTQQPALAQWRADMLASINAERARAGAAPLANCAALERAAQAHSADQAAHNRMTHTGSNGSNAGQRIAAAGYTGGLGWGENVAVGYPSVSSVMQGWMNSSGHRANILNPSYQHVGLGKATSSSGRPYWTQNFARAGTC